MKLKFILGYTLFGIGLGFLLGKYLPINFNSSSSLISPVAPTPKPLDKYSFTSLQSYSPVSSPIIIDSIMFEEPKLTAYLAHYTTQSKRMSLQLMVPTQATPSAGFPHLLMIRGFVDPANYQTGVGTKNAARYFAARGFVTIAPDFLGFGQSDPPPIDTMAARLEKPAQLQDLLASITSLSFINSSRLGIWGHSNGGQIAISLLEITGRPIPTVLWAPVTKPFPYSLLYYTDEYDDGGKALRKTIAEFELDYDVFNYSQDKYSDRITAPIQLHQGAKDDAVPQEWSNQFVDTINTKTKLIEYFTYPQADHNLRPDWDTVVDRSFEFFATSI